MTHHYFLRRLFLLLPLLMGLTLTTSAQDRYPFSLYEKLKLSHTQTSQLQALQDQVDDELALARKAGTLDRAKMLAVRESFHRQAKEMLSTSQREELAVILATRQEKIRDWELRHQGTQSAHSRGDHESGQQHLTFEVKQAGPVTVEITDSEGRALRQIFANDLRPGKHQLEVSVNDLDKENSYYRIVSADGVKTIALKSL